MVRWEYLFVTQVDLFLNHCHRKVIWKSIYPMYNIQNKNPFLNCNKHSPWNSCFYFCYPRWLTGISSRMHSHLEPITNRKPWFQDRGWLISPFNTIARVLPRILSHGILICYGHPTRFVSSIQASNSIWSLIHSDANDPFDYVVGWQEGAVLRTCFNKSGYT